jgi:methionyl-tRNA formyltransferase
MRLLYFGSGAFGLPTVEMLHARHELVAVVSQPDKPAGRKRVLTPTPVAAWALERGIEVLRAEDVNTPGFVEKVAGYKADASIVIAFGQKLGEPLIDAMGDLAVNLHASLLPKYRGAAPINWAMIDGERRTGVSVIGLAQKMDAGPVYAEASLAIEPSETAGELHDRLAALGPEAIGKVLDDLAGGTLGPREQDHDLATKAPKMSKAIGTVVFDQASEVVRSRVHGLTPWPGCRVNWECKATGKSAVLTLGRVSAVPDLSCFIGLESAGEEPVCGTVLLPGVGEDYHVRTADGAVRLVEVQAPGTKMMGIADFARGHKLGAGDVLTAIEEA